MQTRSGKIINSGCVPIKTLDQWPTPQDVTPVYHSSFFEMNQFIVSLFNNPRDGKLIILEICETIFLNKHLIIYSESWEYFINTLIRKFTSLNHDITTFDKNAYVNKLSKLVSIDYQEIKDTFDPIKRELMAFYYHPSRVRKYIEINY